jgi:hypothetical protein
MRGRFMRKLLVAVCATAAGAALAVPAFAQDEAAAEEEAAPVMTMMNYATAEHGVHVTGSADATVSFGSNNISVATSAGAKVAASAATDGGLTVSATIDIEDNEGSTFNGDLSVAGSFGTISIANGAGPGTGGQGKGPSWAAADYLAGPVEAGGAAGVAFALPAIGGLSAGISHQPAASGNGETAVGIGFSSDVGGTNVSAGGVWVSSGGSASSWGVGASVGVELATIDVRYDDVAGGNSNDRYGIGVSTTMGALTLGAGFGLNELQGATAATAPSLISCPAPSTALFCVTPGTAATGGVRTSTVAAGAVYDLGGGAKTSGGLQWTNPDGGTSTVGVSLRIALEF